VGAGLARVIADRRVIAIDGKTLRGSAPHSTSEQVAAARSGGGRTHLVAGFTARELAADLRERGAHWILPIKGNQKTLHARLKALPWNQVPEAARVRSVGHGRTETRTIRLIDLQGSRDGRGEFFPGAAQA